MKILHTMLASFYIDGYSYQENLLPKYHKLQGHDVKIVASLFSFDENGKGIYLKKMPPYINEQGIPVTRLDYKPGKTGKRLRKYIGLREEIENFGPDIIFVHGVQFRDISIIKDYAKKHNVTIYVDNHADHNNSAQNFASKYILHKVIWGHWARTINPYVKKFYGVTPARVDFLVSEYKIPRKKVELLVMGADDELVKKAESNNARARIREKYGIKDDDFLVITGGKIDNNKRQVLLLMDAINNISDPKVKLLVFGSALPELQPEIDKRLSSKVQHIGWVQSDDTYDIFAAADATCFPGGHSVFWEQVAAQGIPMILKRWDGATHIDAGGNVIFLEEDSAKEIEEKILEIMKPETYERVSIAASKAKDGFLYGSIARRSIEQ